VGLKLIFLVVSRAVSLLGLSRRESWWKDAEILMLRHQLAVAERERPRTRARLTWPDRAWLALLAGTVPIERLAAMWLIVTPGTILRWHRDIVRRRWSRRSRQSRSGRPATHRKVETADTIRDPRWQCKDLTGNASSRGRPSSGPTNLAVPRTRIVPVAAL
jgi:putative transposase